MRKEGLNYRYSYEAVSEDQEASGVSLKQLGAASYSEIPVMDARQKVTNILNGNHENSLRADQALRFIQILKHSYYYLAFVFMNTYEFLSPQQTEDFLIEAINELKEKLSPEQKERVAAGINDILGFSTPQRKDGKEIPLEQKQSQIINNLKEATKWFSKNVEELGKIDCQLHPTLSILSDEDDEK